jgi:hypothetical protein
MKKIYLNETIITSLLIIITTLSASKYNFQDDKPNAGLTIPQGFAAGKGLVRDESRQGKTMDSATKRWRLSFVVMYC